MDPLRKKVFLFAIISRFLFLILSALSDLIIPNYTSDAFVIPSYVFEEVHSDDTIIWRLFKGLLQWDAHHFLHIAEFGYTYENNLAFFPLFPMLIRTVGNMLKAFHVVSNTLPAYLLSAVIINNVAFVKTTLVLYDMTLFIFNDTKFAFRTSILFCVSPATVFFIAPYSETLFAFCAFKGMLGFLRRQTKASLIWFFLSCGLRSNGITFAGFLLHLWAYCCLSQMSFSSLRYKARLCVRFTLYTFEYILVLCCPYILFQLFSYIMFCHVKPNEDRLLIRDYADTVKLTMASDDIEWCHKHVLPYFVIQEKYWNVGFLKYYSLKQIPNFLLVFPICYFVIYHGIVYFKKHWSLLFNPKIIYTYTLFPFEPKKFSGNYPPVLFLFFVHAMFLTFWGLLNINVQVLTRLISSSSPIVYWVAANAFESLPRRTKKDKFFKKLLLLPFENELVLDMKASFVKWYFVGYAVIGIVLFSNGLPWT